MNYESSNYSELSKSIQDDDSSSSNSEEDEDNKFEVLGEDIPDEENYTYVKNDYDFRTSEFKKDFENFDLK